MSVKYGIICCEDAEKWGGPDGGRFLMDMFRNHPDEEWEYYKATQMNLPDLNKLNEYGGFILSGSHYSANDPHPWVDELEGFIRHVFEYQHNHAESAPKLVGICFGHQIMAKAMGAKVVKNECGKFVFELCNVNVRAEGREKDFYREVFGGGDSFVLFGSHSEEVKELPATIKSVASSEHCENEIILYGNGAGLSLQGHMEITNEQCFQLILPAIKAAGLFSQEDETKLKEDYLKKSNQREQVIKMIKHFMVQ